MEKQWYFSDDLSPGNIEVDELADSKFGIDKWQSFAREIIQNSIDVQDNKDEPVYVTFELNKQLTSNDIPGCKEITDILEKCIKNAKNAQTRSAYEMGLNILKKNKIYCLKVSDYNTLGVKTGLNEDWGGLLFDEGNSTKRRPGSAGSHGVGKKVSFVVSSCKTVFYSTKNKYKINESDEDYRSDCLVQGKSMLINWTDNNGKKKSPKGWYGIKNNSPDDQNRDIILPIEGNELNDINEYFIRKNKYGTDVIVIGVNLYENEDDVKRYMINTILDNFYVSIINKTLKVNVFGVEIDKSNIKNIYKKYYKNNDNSKFSLFDELDAYGTVQPEEIEIKDKNDNLAGNIKIYFKLGNERDKKYFSVVRSHGMRITEYQVRAEQPFTAVIYVEGDILNSKLLDLENAAHNDFITEGDEVSDKKDSIYLLNKLKEKVRNYIIEKTKIDENDIQNIEDLGSILNLDGINPTVQRKNEKPTLLKSKVIRKGMGQKSDNYDNGQGNEGGRDKSKNKKHHGDHKPAKRGNNNVSILYENYAIEPFFTINKNNEYELKFVPSETINNAKITVRSINNEGTADKSILNSIDYAIYNGIKYPFDKENGSIDGLDFQKDKVSIITFMLNRNILYKLSIRMLCKEDNIYE